MERGFYQEDIEHLIKQKADQYKMYPSEKVWKGVYRSLHTRRKWYLLSFVLFLSGIGYYTAELLSPSLNKPVADNPATVSSKTQNDTKQQATIIPFGNSVKQDNSSTAKSEKTTSFIINPDNPETRDIQPAVVNNDNNTEDVPTAIVIAEPAPVYDLHTGRLKEIPGTVINDLALTPVNDENLPLAFSTPALEDIEKQTGRNNNSNILTANNHSEESNEDGRKINWLEQYAAFELTPAKAKRLNWQLAFSPTMNYRRLTGSPYANMAKDVKNVPFALNIEGDPDKLLNHKPALGFELGSHFVYTLNKDLSLKAGLQFNYSRYDIQAYSAETERATIALNSVGPASNITTYTSIRNFGGDEVKDLRNQYFQLSVPVGLELRLAGNNKLQLNIAGSLQPTYLLNKNTYLVTTDYKNYTKEPSLVRRWNLNTAAEAFVSYKTGELKWQVGPQFRYQLLSTYTSKYPIRENLMEYGIKIGVTKTIR